MVYITKLLVFSWPIFNRY